MTIDISKIKPGDRIRGRVAVEFAGAVMEDGSIDYDEDVKIAILGSDVTILEHIPARPDWADALVLRVHLIEHERLVLAHGEGRFTDDHGHDWTTAGLSSLATTPEIVLDADGNPPKERFDKCALDRLPHGSLALSDPRTHYGDPLVKERDGLWYPASRVAGAWSQGLSSADIAPARVIWQPES